MLLPFLDAYVDGLLPSWLSALLFGGDAGAARTLLDAISSSLITVTSLTFSLTVVTLQLASSQFSPRLLRTFTSDVFVQATLSVFLATFSYALTLLRAVRSSDAGAAFVPRISITVAFALGVTSVLGLVLFLAHLARQIRVETMLRDVHDDASATVVGATSPLDDVRPRPDRLKPPPDAFTITAASSGFMTSIDEAELLSAAIHADAFLVIDRHPGSSLIEGIPIGSAWSAGDGLDDAGLEALRSAVHRAIGVGYERTAAQDLGYGLRQPHRRRDQGTLTGDQRSYNGDPCAGTRLGDPVPALLAGICVRSSCGTTRTACGWCCTGPAWPRSSIPRSPSRDVTAPRTLR